MQAKKGFDYPADISAFADDLDEYLRQRYSYRRRIVSSTHATISAHRVRFGMHLRFKPTGAWPEKTLVIAQLWFRRQRAGEASALLEFVTRVASHHQIEHVGLEVIVTPAGAALRDAFGSIELAEGSQNCAVVSIGALGKRLNERARRRQDT